MKSSLFALLALVATLPAAGLPADFVAEQVNLQAALAARAAPSPSRTLVTSGSSMRMPAPRWRWPDIN